MTGQREGFLGDILDKVKDIITPDDDNTPDRPAEKPPVITPKCCGQIPKFIPTMDGEDITPVEHDADCPNHPDNVAKEGVA